MEALVNKENYKNVGLVPQIQEDKTMNKMSIRFYNNREVRAIWSDNDSRWFYSATDIVRAINNESDYVKAGNYWRWLKKKLAAQGIQPVSDTHKFKLVGPDGKKRVADVMDDNGVMLLAKHYSNNRANEFRCNRSTCRRICLSK